MTAADLLAVVFTVLIISVLCLGWVNELHAAVIRKMRKWKVLRNGISYTANSKRGTSTAYIIIHPLICTGFTYKTHTGGRA